MKPKDTPDVRAAQARLSRWCRCPPALAAVPEDRSRRRAASRCSSRPTSKPKPVDYVLLVPREFGAEPAGPAVGQPPARAGLRRGGPGRPDARPAHALPRALRASRPRRRRTASRDRSRARDFDPAARRRRARGDADPLDPAARRGLSADDEPDALGQLDAPGHGRGALQQAARDGARLRQPGGADVRQAARHRRRRPVHDRGVDRLRRCSRPTRRKARSPT